MRAMHVPHVVAHEGNRKHSPSNPNKTKEARQRLRKILDTVCGKYGTTVEKSRCPMKNNRKVTYLLNLGTIDYVSCFVRERKDKILLIPNNFTVCFEANSHVWIGRILYREKQGKGLKTNYGDADGESSPFCAYFEVCPVDDDGEEMIDMSSGLQENISAAFKISLGKLKASNIYGEKFKKASMRPNGRLYIGIYYHTVQSKLCSHVQMCMSRGNLNVDAKLFERIQWWMKHGSHSSTEGVTPMEEAITEKKNYKRKRFEEPPPEVSMPNVFPQPGVNPLLASNSFSIPVAKLNELAENLPSISATANLGSLNIGSDLLGASLAQTNLINNLNSQFLAKQLSFASLAGFGLSGTMNQNDVVQNNSTPNPPLEAFKKNWMSSINFSSDSLGIGSGLFPSGFNIMNDAIENNLQNLQSAATNSRLNQTRNQQTTGRSSVPTPFAARNTHMIPEPKEEPIEEVDSAPAEAFYPPEKKINTNLGKDTLPVEAVEDDEPTPKIDRQASMQSLRSFSELAGVHLHHEETFQALEKTYTDTEMQEFLVNNAIEQIDGSFLIDNDLTEKTERPIPKTGVGSLDKYDKLSCNMTNEALYLVLSGKSRPKSSLRGSGLNPNRQNEEIHEQDFKKGLKCLRIPWTAHTVRKTYEACDKNKDGKVSMTEFVQYIKEREVELKKMFDEIDVGKDGYLTVDELKAAMKNGIVNLKATDDQIKHLIHWMEGAQNAEKDGKLSFEEFRINMVLFPPATSLQEIIDMLQKKRQNQPEP
eukprot:maker-scaffold_13-snap-gene-7.3-mRNA-1 protein AED:0.00 eAED:0.00 QI:116/1/1/1/1/1/2/66/760